ncbi:MAG: efflux transporter outer membrane subunit [Variovorax sp.]|nr:MAG: efflux transporter outer membrane subunit [Variovorax sp.]
MPRRPPPCARVLPLTLCVLLASCGLARPPARVDAATPTQWNAPLPNPSTAPATSVPPAGPTTPAAEPGVPPSALPHGGSTAALAAWWRRFDDPVLATLIDAGQAANPNVASAAARIAEARGARTQAGAALLPALDGTLSAQRSNSPFGTGVAAGGDGTSLPGLTTLQGGLQSRWELDLFGGLRAGRDAADARLRSADARWHDARVSVAAETANRYVGERACQRQLLVSVSDARSRAETARLTDLSAGAGFTAPASAALARASAADASARLTQQRVQCTLLRKGLSALTAIDGRALDALLDAAPTDREPPPVPIVASVPARVLAQRPDVYAAELAVAAASADVGAFEAERYPALTLQGSIAALQLRSGGVHQSLQTWTFGPVALSLPLFDGGVRAANARSARARYEEAVALYRAGARQAVREVEEALVNLQGTEARAGDADTAVRNYQVSFDATQARYDSGLASLFELEDARRTLFATQTARVALQRERAEAWVALYRATGGGWTRPGDDGTAVATTSSPDTDTASTTAATTPGTPTSSPAKLP